MKKTFDNIRFMWKICYKASPKLMIYTIYDVIRQQGLIFIEHALLIRYILRCAEFHEPFYKAAIATLIVVALYLILFIPDGLAVHGLQLREKPKVYKAFKDMLYEKAASTDLDCYDNPKFYNDFVLVISESDNIVDRFFNLLRMAVLSATIFLTTGTLFLMLDKVGLLFLVIAFTLNIVVAKRINKLNYDVKNAMIPFEKKRNYVGRIFYISDYAKELRLHQEVGDMLEDEYEDANAKMMDIQKKVGLKRAWLKFVQRYALRDFVTDGLYIAFLVFKAAVLHNIAYSDAVILFNRTGELRRGMSDTADLIPLAKENDLYIDKVRDFLAYEEQIRDGEEDNIAVGDIELKDISFRYNPTMEDTLKHISLTVKQGERIAIVGYNGAGKTTLVKLLMRLYDTTEGTIEYAGKDIKEYSLDAYRNHMGVVFQDYQIYGATLAENVIMDKPEEVIYDTSSKENQDIVEALDHSGFTKRLAKLSDGIRTPLTTEFDPAGINLSGGEAQKVATARTFYKNAKILIMDEPSSALDPIAEYSLNKTMDEMAQGKTVFYISHRLSTTRDADRIIVLEAGSIIEEGTHDELLKANGTYARMWKAQAGRYEHRAS